jgi:F0F1-type ATP synthase membrane subunit b/b'
MDKDFLKLIKEAEEEAAGKIEAAKNEAAEIEKNGIRTAESLGADTRAEWIRQKERELSDAQYNIKKKYDNQKTFLTVSLNDTRIKASENVDSAAKLIIERILNG